MGTQNPCVLRTQALSQPGPRKDPEKPSPKAMVDGESTGPVSTQSRLGVLAPGHHRVLTMEVERSTYLATWKGNGSVAINSALPLSDFFVF